MPHASCSRACCRLSGNLTSLMSSPAFFACSTFNDPMATQPAPFIHFTSALYRF